MSSPPPPPGEGEPNPQFPYGSSDPTNRPGPLQRTDIAHHESEFGEFQHGEVEYIASDRESEDHALPAPILTRRRDPIAAKERRARLLSKLFHHRQVQQYFIKEKLHRGKNMRSIGADELFLDLILVGGLAALGHELRNFFEGWASVEKFILLFAAILSSWRSIVFVWNSWGVASDLIDKAGIYLVFFSLTGIAVGAHGAFTDGLRPYVSVCAFAATAIPTLSTFIWSAKDDILKKSNMRIPQYTITFVCTMLSVLPYLIAAFMPTAAATRALFWVGLVLTQVVVPVAVFAARLLNGGKIPDVRFAVNIELFVEKFETLTMIVLGESVLGILFESELVVLKQGVRIGALYGCVAAAAAMLYSLQTLYHNVDGKILRGGKHAIRHNRWKGMFWSMLHFPYQASLVMFATGIGLALRDIAIPPTKGPFSGGSYGGGADKLADHASVVAQVAQGAVETLADTVLRAGGGGAGPPPAGSGYASFKRESRWLFAVGWGLSLIFSGLIGSMHLGGDRARTRTPRLAVRFVIAAGLAVGMPLTEVSADVFVLVFAAAVVVVTIIEFMLVAMDRLAFFGGGSSGGRGSSSEFVNPLEDIPDGMKSAGDVGATQLREKDGGGDAAGGSVAGQGEDDDEPAAVRRMTSRRDRASIDEPKPFARDELTEEEKKEQEAAYGGAVC